MQDTAPRPAQTQWHLLPPLMGSALFAIGSGVLQTLMPLRLQKLGFETTEIGLVATGYAAGFTAGCLLLGRLIGSVGHVRASAAFAAAAAVTVLAFDFDLPIAVFVALLAGTGMAASGLYMVTESWLNELTLPERRSRVLTIYVIVLTLAWGLGQVIAIDIDPAGSRMLMITASFYALALIPFAAVKVESPKPLTGFRIRLFYALGVSPSGFVCCLFTGLVSLSFFTIGPLYGAARGFSQRDIVLLMATVQLGGLALQWPLGLVSDRFDRREVLSVMAVALIIVSVGFLALQPGSPFWVLALLFAGFGGLAEAFYPIGVAHTNDRTDGDYVTLSSNLLLIWSVGGMIGPLIGTTALQFGGPDAFFWYVIGLSLSLAGFLRWRLRRKRLEEATREEFLSYPHASPTVFEWSPHTPLPQERSPRPGTERGGRG